MSVLQAILLGIIQGLTEYLPISSTAHLRIIPALLGWSDPGAAFTAVIQFGTLVAVLWYFWKDIIRILIAVLNGIKTRRPLENHDSLMGWMIAVGTIPIVILGLLFKDDIETGLRSLYVIAASMIFLALILMLAELIYKKRLARGANLKTIGQLSWMEVIVVGLAQCVALIPGASRSGCTITGGLFVGMTRETAARFSFLLSLPSVFAAGVFELLEQRHALLSTDIGAANLIIATVVSGIVGYASIAFLLSYLKKHSTYLFIVYRIVLGMILLGFLWNGTLIGSSIKPLLRMERQVFYEGEDVRMTIYGPFPGSGESGRQPIQFFNQSPVALTLFRGNTDLTDSVAEPGGDVPMRYLPHFPGEWRINKYYHLIPGKYKCSLGVGGKNETIAFSVVPMPDSLAATFGLHRKLGALPRTEMMTRLVERNFKDDLREYSRILINEPPGTPLRAEGLRFSSNRLPRHGRPDAQANDSLLLQAVVRRFVQEPRSNPEDIYYALWRYCSEDWERNDPCISELASRWGSAEVVDEIKLRLKEAERGPTFP